MKLFKKIQNTLLIIVFSISSLTLFAGETDDAKSNLNKIQNKKNILFCGSYFGYGFHEDGIKSSIEMLKTLND